MFSSLAAMEPSHLISAVISIIILDLVLSGDNAAVIGMAIRHLPQDLRKKAATVGAMLAIVLRIICTIFATVLLTIPYFSLGGGVLLLFIAAHLLKSGQDDNGEGVKDRSSDIKNSFLKAVGIIVIADASMAIDNVLAVAGAAHGQPLLVILGLLVSIPILIFASTWLASMMKKFPIILWIGAAVLVRTALSMIIEERSWSLAEMLGYHLSILLPFAIAAIVLIYGITKIIKQRRLQ